MNPNISSERALQDNVIELLKSMGYEFISKEDNIKLRDGKLGDVLLKSILAQQLQSLNSFEYKGKKYLFSAKNIKQAIEDINEPLNQG
ncbi:hypothetical protein [Campylobacter pinnipediorum]|uniref:hypothetical protein n=1 Tax=Campylobacter pinnipediorum TaxID=1965231 RepID=UPI001E4251A4|nr:hypothetical protein [Campylobacter pinnipediorum]